jgi:lysophospholipase L1-like esterase
MAWKAGRLTVVAALLLLLAQAAASAEEGDGSGFFLEDGQRLLFLGDSITQAGHYVDYVDAYLFTRFPGRDYELINIGLSSETVSGLTEPDHPFPRPDLHDRLDRALQMTEPDVVVACYGMNDGIYHPFGEDRFAAYRDGIHRLIEKVHAAGARLVLMTPPPFDPIPIADKTVGGDAPEHGYKTPYRYYDTVLRLYGAWVLAQRERVAGVVDLHTPLKRFVDRRRESDPGDAIAGDGVHPGRFGHWLMAQEILKAWGAGPIASRTEAADSPAAFRSHTSRDALDSFLKLVDRRQQLLSNAWREHVGHGPPDRPEALPLEEAKQKAAELEDRIRELARPMELDLRLVPAE